jgi:hypothetical protein
MSIETKIVAKTARRKGYQVIAEGIATVNVYQGMRYARRSAKSGSLDSDWRIVGKEIADAVSSVKKEYCTD